MLRAAATELLRKSPESEEARKADASSSQISDGVNIESATIRILQELPDVSNLISLTRVLPLVQDDVDCCNKYCNQQENFLRLLQETYYESEIGKPFLQKQANLVSHAVARRKVMCAP